MTPATSRRWTRALAVVAPLALAAAVTPWLVGVARAPAPAGAGAQQPGDEIDAEALYLEGCASCHGADGRGARAPDGGMRGPALGRAGEASAYYYLSTGRMPLDNSEEQPTRKPPAYSREEIEALTAYVASLGAGPDLPDIDLEDADLSRGGEIFRLNCQACHGASGSGGALSYGRAAPSLAPAAPLEIAAAVRAGPGQMPVFGPQTITDSELDDLVAYVEYLDDPEDPGGLPIGRTGPIPEGFVAWLVGMVGLLVLVAWIGTRNPIREVVRR
ncbi:MAG TPA: c-type cytochrome [Acidimicrobiales bacterium]